MRRLIALALAGLVVVVLVVAQLVLPGIAADRLRSDLERRGTVLEVKVSAFPAIQLLWRHADSVVVRMGRYQSAAGQLGQRLASASGVGKIDASVQELDTGALTLRDAVLRKRGSVLTGTATVTEADLRSAVPFLQNVQPVASSEGALIMRGTASLLGVTATVDAVVAARGGALVVAPNVPFGGIATVTLFNDPHVQVQSVGATSVPGGFEVNAQARLQ